MEEDNSRDVDPLSEALQENIDHQSDGEHDSSFEEQFNAEMDEYLKQALEKGDVDPGSDDHDDPLFGGHSEQGDFLQSGFNEDLYITVSDPEKHVQTMESFITYKVTTKTTRSSFDSSEFVVHRRYHDFVWLSEMLQDEFPTYIIPPLPEKFIVKGMFDRFSEEFTETRCRGLNKFLLRISNHPVVSHSEHLRTFLTSGSIPKMSKLNVFSRIGDSFKLTRSSSAEFEDLVSDLALFNEKMGNMDRVGERMLSERQELSDELKELSLALTDWSKYEEEMTETAMLTISNCLEDCAEKTLASQGPHLLQIVPIIKEYALYADAVKMALKRRDSIEGQFVKCGEELKAREEEKENLTKTDQTYSFGALMGKSPAQVCQEKEEKLDQQISELSEQKERLNDVLAKANSDFRTEVERWKKQKTNDIATIFSKMADTQITFHNDCATAWNNAVSSIQTPATKEETEGPPI